MKITNDLSIYGVKAAVHLSGFPNAEIWHEGRKFQAVAVRLGEDDEAHLVLISNGGDGRWTAALMRRADGLGEWIRVRYDSETPLASLAHWQLLVDSFGLAGRVLAFVKYSNAVKRVSGVVSMRTSHSAQDAAFSVAVWLGWDYLSDDNFMQWSADATEEEILTEGLRRALENCQCGEKDESHGNTKDEVRESADGRESGGA